MVNHDFGNGLVEDITKADRMILTYTFRFGGLGYENNQSIIRTRWQHTLLIEPLNQRDKGLADNRPQFLVEDWLEAIGFLLPELCKDPCY